MDKVKKYTKLYHIGRLHPTETSSNQFAKNDTELKFAKNNQIKQDFAKLRKLAFDMVGYSLFLVLFYIELKNCFGDKSRAYSILVSVSICFKLFKFYFCLFLETTYFGTMAVIQCRC